jgi:hypothetical protein
VSVTLKNPPQVEGCELKDRLHDEEANPCAIGCSGCVDFEICGGLHTHDGFFDCSSLCNCPDKERCDKVCRAAPGRLVKRMWEVDGFGLENVQRASPLPVPSLPAVVPLIGNGSCRSQLLQAEAVSIPLSDLYNLRNGEFKVGSAAALAARYKLAPGTPIVASGVDHDERIEPFWKLHGRPGFLKDLAKLGVVLFTAPNYSMFLNVPRPDNLHAMKRIAWVWAEMTKAGLPTALHINARTDHDYRRWGEFIRYRDEVRALAFEFGTGAGHGDRMDWHAQRLAKLADEAGRPLTLVVRGGSRVLPLFRKHFAQVVFLDSVSFMRTMKRRKAWVNRAGKLRWRSSLTAKGAPLDDLLNHNLAVVKRQVVAPRLSVRTRKQVQLGLRARPAQNADRKSRQGSFARDLDLTLRVGAVTAKQEGVVAASKPDVGVEPHQRSEYLADADTSALVVQPGVAVFDGQLQCSSGIRQVRIL